MGQWLAGCQQQQRQWPVRKAVQQCRNDLAGCWRWFGRSHLLHASRSIWRLGIFNGGCRVPAAASGCAQGCKELIAQNRTVRICCRGTGLQGVSSSVWWP